jgi:hypothetical protein
MFQEEVSSRLGPVKHAGTCYPDAWRLDLIAASSWASMSRDVSANHAAVTGLGHRKIITFIDTGRPLLTDSLSETPPRQVVFVRLPNSICLLRTTLGLGF